MFAFLVEVSTLDIATDIVAVCDILTTCLKDRARRRVSVDAEQGKLHMIARIVYNLMSEIVRDMQSVE